MWARVGLGLGLGIGHVWLWASGGSCGACMCWCMCYMRATCEVSYVQRVRPMTWVRVLTCVGYR